jgi:hypothetical protein
MIVIEPFNKSSEKLTFTESQKAQEKQDTGREGSHSYTSDHLANSLDSTQRRHPPKGVESL